MVRGRTDSERNNPRARRLYVTEIREKAAGFGPLDGSLFFSEKSAVGCCAYVRGYVARIEFAEWERQGEFALRVLTLCSTRKGRGIKEYIFAKPTLHSYVEIMG